MGKRRIEIGRLMAGPYCGSSVFRKRDWKLSGLFGFDKNSFHIGPMLFWIEPK